MHGGGGVVLGLALAVVASIVLNASYMIQHKDLASAPAVSARRPLATVRALFTSKLWLAGAILGTVGWAMHVGALTKAPLSLVQAFFAGGLALAVPMAVVLAHHRLQRSELVGIAVMVIALIGLSVGAPNRPDSHFAALSLGIYLLASCGVAALLGLAPRDRRSHALGLAGGILYGASDVAIKALTGIAAHHGVLHIFTSPWLAAAVVTNVSAFFCFQRGLQTGSALAVIALMTAGTNVISIVGGLLVYGDPLGKTVILSIAHVIAFILVGVGGWLLAPAQAAITTGGEVTHA